MTSTTAMLCGLLPGCHFLSAIDADAGTASSDGRIRETRDPAGLGFLTVWGWQSRHEFTDRHRRGSAEPGNSYRHRVRMRRLARGWISALDRLAYVR